MIKRFVALLLILLACFQISATPFAGAYFEVDYLGGTNYRVTLHFIRNCSAVSAPTQVPIEFENSMNPAFNFTNAFASFLNNDNLVKTCPSAINECSGGNYIGMQDYTYSGIVNLPPGEWTISYWSCCRNPVNVMGTSYNNGFYVETKINNHITLNNQLPVFNQSPKMVSYTNQEDFIDYSATDPDGDSLVYELIQPLEQNALPIAPYIGGYTYLNPFPTNSTPHLDSLSGVFTFNGQFTFSSLLAVRVLEYRNIGGTTHLLSSNIIDHEIYFVSGHNNPPILGGIDTAGTTYSVDDTVYTAIIPAQFPYSMNIFGHDEDTLLVSSANESTYSISWDSGIANASFLPQNLDTDSAFATFSWTPTMDDTTGIHTFRATIADSACPYIGINKYEYHIKVKRLGDLSITPYVNTQITYLFCNHETVELFAPSGYDHYIWETGESTESILLDSTYLSVGMNHITCLLKEGEFSYLASIDVYMDDCTGIEDFKKSGVQVYPNPANDLLNVEVVEFENNYSIEIINLEGKVVISMNNINNNQQQIDISQLSEGVYFLNVMNQKKDIFRRFIKL